MAQNEGSITPATRTLGKTLPQELPLLGGLPKGAGTAPRRLPTPGDKRETQPCFDGAKNRIYQRKTRNCCPHNLCPHNPCHRSLAISTGLFPQSWEIAEDVHSALADIITQTVAQEAITGYHRQVDTTASVASHIFPDQQQQRRCKSNCPGHDCTYVRLSKWQASEGEGNPAGRVAIACVTVTVFAAPHCRGYAHTDVF